MIAVIPSTSGAATENIIPWLSLGASLLLALITLWYVKITARTLKQAQAVEYNRNEAALRKQAESIAAWVSESHLVNSSVDLKVSIRNPSDQAVYAIAASVFDLGVDRPLGKVDVQGVLGPKDGIEKDFSCHAPGTATGDLRVQISFVDARGVSWTRDKYGKLAPAPSLANSPARQPLRQRILGNWRAKTTDKRSDGTGELAQT